MTQGMRVSGIARLVGTLAMVFMASCVDGTVVDEGGTGGPSPSANPDPTPTPTPSPSGNPDPTPTPSPSVTPSPSPSPSPAAGDFAVTAAIDSATSNLGEKRTVTLTITPSNGFTGMVALQGMTMPTGFTATFNPSTVTVGAAAVTATATVQVPTDARVGATTLGFGGSNGTLVKTATVSVDVKPELVIRIARGVAITNNNQAFGLNPTNVPLLATGTKVTWINDDMIDHRIHSGVSAFPHQPSNLVPGASYSVTITQAGTFNYNCHVHAGMKGSFKVAVPPTP